MRIERERDNKIECEYLRLLQRAEKGHEWWGAFSDEVKFDFEMDAVVILSNRFISSSVEIAEWITNVKKSRGHNRVFTIVDSPLPNWPKELSIVNVGEEVMKNIIQFSKLVEFTKFIYPIIFEEPFGNLNMLGKEATFSDYLNGVAK